MKLLIKNINFFLKIINKNLKLIKILYFAKIKYNFFIQNSRFKKILIGKN